MLASATAGGIGTLFSFACHKYWTLEGLNRFAHVPSIAGFEGFAAVGTIRQFTFDDDPLGISKGSFWTVSGLFRHISP
jgi:putative flippase GtrA